MGTINFTFMGICTVFDQANHPTLTPKVRIVLINASNPAGFTINGTFIPPHFATMSIPGQGLMPLTGYKIDVATPAGASLDTSGLQALPNLTALTNGALGAPAFDVVFGKNPLLAAAYFDFYSGTFTSCEQGGAAQTNVTVETTGLPQLQLTQFPTKPFPAPEPTFITTGLPDMTVMVNNVSINEANSTFHFWLNYLTGQLLPAELPLPDTSNMPACNGSEIAGPGCSNSSYP